MGLFGKSSMTHKQAEEATVKYLRKAGYSGVCHVEATDELTEDLKDGIAVHVRLSHAVYPKREKFHKFVYRKSDHYRVHKGEYPFNLDYTPFGDWGTEYTL